MEFDLRQTIPVHILTDSKSMIDIISKGSRTSEKGVMLDVYAAQQAHKAKEISTIGFVRSSHKLADGLTKPKVQAALYQLLKTAYHKPKDEQKIIRGPR